MIRVLTFVLLALMVAKSAIAGGIYDTEPQHRDDILDIIAFQQLAESGQSLGGAHDLSRKGWRLDDSGKTVNGVGYHSYVLTAPGARTRRLILLDSDISSGPFDLLSRGFDDPDPALSWARQYRDARQIVSRYRHQSNEVLYLSGVHAAGALAQHAAMVHDTRAVVFSSLPVSPEAIAAGDHFDLEPGVVASNPDLDGRIYGFRTLGDIVPTGDGFQLGRQIIVPLQLSDPANLDLMQLHQLAPLLNTLQRQSQPVPPPNPREVLILVDDALTLLEAINSIYGTSKDILDAAELASGYGHYVTRKDIEFTSVVPKPLSSSMKLFGQALKLSRALVGDIDNAQSGDLVPLSGRTLNALADIGINEFQAFLLNTDITHTMSDAARTRTIGTLGTLNNGGLDIAASLITMLYKGTVYDHDALTGILGNIAPAAAYAATFGYTGNHYIASVAAGMAELIVAKPTKDIVDGLLYIRGWTTGASRQLLEDYQIAQFARISNGQHTQTIEEYYNDDATKLAKIGRDVIAHINKITNTRPAPRRQKTTRKWTRRTHTSYREICTRGICTRTLPNGASIPSRQDIASQQILATITPYDPPRALPRIRPCDATNCTFDLTPPDPARARFDPDSCTDDDTDCAAPDAQDPSDDDDDSFGDCFGEGCAPGGGGGGGGSSGAGGGDDGCVGEGCGPPLCPGPNCPSGKKGGDDGDDDDGCQGALCSMAPKTTLAVPPIVQPTPELGGVSVDPKPTRRDGKTGLSGVLETCSFANAGCRITK